MPVARSPTILVVDDEDLIRWSMRQVLTRVGYRVVVAASGDEARARCEESPPDLVLLDLKLPDTDGLKLLPTLRPAERPIPVIIMTAYGSRDLEIQARKLGAQHVVAKPFDPDDLCQLIGQALSGPPPAAATDAP
jgi:CheY-like chemotaxis protein